MATLNQKVNRLLIWELKSTEGCGISGSDRDSVKCYEYYVFVILLYLCLTFKIVF